MLMEQFLVDPRTVMETLEVGAGDELQEVPVAGVVPGNEHQMIGRALIGSAVAAATVGDIEFAADNGLYADFFTF